jgi:hypothetical protein
MARTGCKVYPINKLSRVRMWCVSNTIVLPASPYQGMSSYALSEDFAVVLDSVPLSHTSDVAQGAAPAPFVAPPVPSAAPADLPIHTAGTVPLATSTCKEQDASDHQ